LGVGETQAFSRDGRWALTIDFGPPTRILVLPTGLGTQKTIVSGGIAAQQANWLPDGARIVFAGAAPGQPSRLYVQEIDATAPPRPVSPDGTAASGAASSLPVSPDGRAVVATGPDGKAAIFPLDGGAPRPIAGLGPRDVVIRWTADGSALLVATTGPLPMRVERLEPGSGRRTLWKEFTVDDPAGIYGGAHYLRVTPDGSTWVWSPVRLLHDLFIAEGLK
jgi:Tol biopolymer transport system component